MNLYLISQGVNSDYDTYDSAVVVAKTAGDAKKIHPNKKDWDGTVDWSWVSIKNVKVKVIGLASRKMKEGEVVCASFNAG